MVVDRRVELLDHLHQVQVVDSDLDLDAFLEVKVRIRQISGRVNRQPAEEARRERCRVERVDSAVM